MNANPLNSLYETALSIKCIIIEGFNDILGIFKNRIIEIFNIY